MFSTNTTYNSDLGTYDLFQQLEHEFNHYISTSIWRNKLQNQYFEVTPDFVRNVIYPKMKQEAEILAEKIARNATTQRWGPAASTTLVHQITEILFSRNIRRGSIPFESEDLNKRIKLIQDGLKTDDGLRFSILMLPNRDLNKAKNDGYLPDLGEIIALLQLWSMIKAMLIVTDKYTELLINIFKNVVVSVDTIKDVQNNIMMMLRLKTANLNSSKTSNNISGINRLREELNNNYDVENIEKAELLIHELARHNYTIEWFLQSVEEVIQVQTKSIRLFIVQDARRYACYDTDPNAYIEAYAKCLKETATQFGIDEHIILTSHQNLEQEYPYRDKLNTFINLRAEVYAEKFEMYSRPFYEAKSDLLRCTTRESFLTLVNQLALNESISQLIEPVLYGRNHPELVAAQLSSNEELMILAKIYQPQMHNTNLELLRQELLFSSLINGIKYLCSYESQTSTKNKYQLDDIQFLLPGTVRLSVHNKASTCGHFLIKCGPNLHRQPWHGTAGLRLRNNKGSHSISFEVRLSFEYKVAGYIPIFIRKDSTTNNNHQDHLSGLAYIDQPILWIHPHLAQIHVINKDDLSRIFDQINKIRMT